MRRQGAHKCGNKERRFLQDSSDDLSNVEVGVPETAQGPGCIPTRLRLTICVVGVDPSSQAPKSAKSERLFEEEFMPRTVV